ncbi:Ubiquitin system component Cue [Penicillium maclennaniae]|uniref:Ubiquitin system component Cue n=1 Tax=Penicillium maclennaniae TaxID=1343394 RepID=UPI00254132AA|nr:Ubiquitin system component Cue [Penicillium maclennaniae]KAJ5683783.1 Ubiquitin system component Cue [Penicillium maclennaniae]
MSEVQSRSARGRVSARGGRGGFSSRGGRGGNSRSAADNSDLSSFEEGEIGEMKKKYSDTLPTLKELFPDWKDEDLVFALEDSNGELEEAIERITEGNVSQWGEVKKKTAADRTKPKAKEVQSTPTESITASARGARGRGGFEGRGRARGDRGRGGRGGRATTHTNGTRAAAGTTETPVAAAVPEPVTTQVAEEVESVPTAGAESESAEPKTTVIPEGTKKGWASLFAKPAPPPPQQKPPQAAPALVSQKTAEPTTEQKAPEPVPAPTVVQKTPVAKPIEPVAPVIPQVTAKPPADDLTETNLEQIPDVSAPAPTATAASTVGSTFDPAAAANATPSRVTSSGLPSSALKQGTRAPGFQRRVMEQQQAVVMPGNHAVDRAAVQFGSMGLNGDAHSPVAPRASLPPSNQGVPETGAARPAPGLPPVPQASAAESFTDFARYGEPQKPFDPFTQQVSQPQQQIQEPFANQTPAQPTATTGGDFSPFYAADQQRFPYYNYGNYGQNQDAGAGPRAAGGFGVSAGEAQSQVPTTQPPSRYGPVDANNSGQNTPNPALPGATAAPAAQHMPGQSQHAYGYGGYPYYSNPPMNQHNYGRNRGMYDDARRYDQEQQQQHYGMPHASQYGYGGQQYGPYGGKGGMYGQPQGFYDHSSPANAGSFNQGAVPGRDSVYGRTGSAQPSDSQQSASGTNAFSSGMSDVFGRSQAGFGQNPPVAGQTPVTAEETKGFEASKTGGPSPSLAQNRPGSATNSVPGQPQAQTGLPPLQGQQGQQGFGAYPQLNPQYGGLGGLGNPQGAASQTHQASGYGGYGAGFSNYYGGNTRGGWGNNYTH